MALTIGTQLGAYEITELLGQGGMGVVYRARDSRLNRSVAIKLLSNELADAEARRRFQRESQTASSLNHPHILSVYDVGEVDDKQYLVMEYIDGGTLRDWARLEKRTWRQVIELMTGVADALATAHAANILHRDIKPENILVSKSGYAKLADFGLAKLEEGKDVHDASKLTAGATRPGTMMGTIPYMSPEQALGRNVDMRSDIFSFGSVLYELISGQPPFTGRSDLETLQKVIDHPPELLPETVPVMVRNVIEKALEKDPAERYQSMREMAVDLKRLTRQKGQGSKQPAVSNGQLRTMAVAAALVIVIAVAAMLLLRNRDRVDDNPLANAQFTRFTDFEGTESDAAISRDGRFVAFRSDRDGPEDTFVSQVGSGRFLNLTHGTQPHVLIKNTGFTPDGSEIWLSALIGGNRLRLVPLLGGNPRIFLSEHALNPAWSPDGSRIVFHTYDPGDPMFVADRSGGNAQQIFTLNAGWHNHFPTWSVDGQWIYFISGLWDAKEMDIFRIRPSGGMPERLTQFNRDVRYLAPLDNRTLLYTSPDQNGAGPWLFALDTERKTSRRISSGLEVYSSVEASGDGRRLAVTVSNPTANLWSVPISDRVTEENDIKSMNLPSVRAFAPRYGGNSLFYLSSNGGGDGLWRYENGQAAEVWRGVDGALFEPAAVSPDGRRVAVILRKQGKRTLQTLSADGADVRPLAPSIDVTSTASWSPDGKWIVAGGVDEKGQGLFKIPVDGGAAVRIASGTISNPVLSPDGSIIVYTGPVVGITGPLLIVRENGTSVEVPGIQVRTGGVRYRFLPGKQQLVYLPGSMVARENFMFLDLSTKSNRQLSNFDTRLISTFDITPDGKQIVFDRLRENSDIVLIDLAK